MDLVLRKDGRKELVQCKQWRNRQVSVAIVREMFGLLVHHGAQAVKIISVGSFTPDAAAGKPIELIGGERLLVLVQEVQAPQPEGEAAPAYSVKPAEAATPARPRRGATMLRRTNRHTNQTFGGCSTYPNCRGTREVETVLLR